MMQNQGGGFPQPPNKSNYYSSIKGLSIVCAIMATLLTAPILAEGTAGWAKDFILKFYGPEFVEWGVIVWKLLCAAAVYFLARAFIVAAVVSLGIGLSNRLPMLLA